VNCRFDFWIWQVLAKRLKTTQFIHFMSYHGQWQWQADLDLDKPTTQNNIQRPDFLFKYQPKGFTLNNRPPVTNSSRLNETIETITPSFTKRETECRRHRSLPRAWCQPRPKSSDHRKDPGISRHRCSNMLSHPNLSTINDKWFNIWVKTLAPCREPQNSWDLWMFIPLKLIIHDNNRFWPTPYDR
jgi:hypothetical protein